MPVALPPLAEGLPLEGVIVPDVEVAFTPSL